MAWEGRRRDPSVGGEQGPWVGSAVARPPQALPADLSQQLGHDLDLLAAAEQVAEGHAGDASHLHGVHQHHEPLQQPQGQEKHTFQNGNRFSATLPASSDLSSIQDFSFPMQEDQKLHYSEGQTNHIKLLDVHRIETK